jgi:hypothetical protein
MNLKKAKEELFEFCDSYSVLCVCCYVGFFYFWVKFDEPDYLYYLRIGLCGYGINCRYNHPAYVLQVIKHLDLHFRCGELSFI